MPNLLAHYGAQGVLTRALLPAAEVRWILLGGFIPDLPWAVRRALHVLLPDLDLHTLRLYAAVQASLLFGLLLAAALALLARRRVLVFAILSLNVALHLTLDSLQEKWGVGVHLLVPARWEEWNAEWFAMEGWTTFGLTGLGVAFCVWAWRRAGPAGRVDEPTVRDPGDPSRSAGVGHTAAAAALLGGYLLLPLPFLDEALASNTHSIRTLAEVEERPGRSLTLDRETYIARLEGDIIVTSSADTLRPDRSYLDRSGAVSVRGVFLDEATLRVDEFKVHVPYFRDAASYLALLVLAAFWLAWARAASRARRRGTGGRLEGSG